MNKQTNKSTNKCATVPTALELPQVMAGAKSSRVLWCGWAPFGALDPASLEVPIRALWTLQNGLASWRNSPATHCGEAEAEVEAPVVAPQAFPIGPVRPRSPVLPVWSTCGQFWPMGRSRARHIWAWWEACSIPFSLCPESSDNPDGGCPSAWVVEQRRIGPLSNLRRCLVEAGNSPLLL